MTWHEHSWYALGLLALLPLLAWRLRAGRGASAVRYSATGPLATLGTTVRTRAMAALPVLRFAGLAVLIVALARPQKGDELTTVFADGVAIQLVADRSGSMRALDFKLDNEPVDRLTAIRKVITDFVRGSGDLPGRPNDLVGLVAFARFPDSRCPLTLDHDYLLETLKQVRPVDYAVADQEDGTAIGDGLALGVERLRELDRQRNTAGQAQRIKSKVIILLTDGQNNAGEVEPLKAAELAARYGIKVYTIGVGTRGLAPIMVLDPFTGTEVPRQMEVNIDEDILRKIADTTGGKYFRATDTDSLRQIYAEIDQLEKTKTEQKTYTDYKELALEPVRVGGVPLPPLLWVAFALLGLEMLLANTWLRRVN